MESVCFINSHNYSQYLEEALESALHQTLPFDRLLIVDDGSTDGSQDIIRAYTEKYSAITAVYKRNGGQLSAFNAIVDLILDESQIFFLDSDDFYPKDYHELILRTVTKPWDIGFSTLCNFIDSNQLQTAKAGNQMPLFLCKSSAITRKYLPWLGTSTSGISISGKLLRAILPCNFEDHFVTRADDVLVYISSVIGAQKIFFPSIQVGWREHGHNNTSSYQNENWQQRAENVLKPLFYFYCKKYSLPINPTIFEVLEEFRCLGQAEQKYILNVMPNLFIRK
jgi:glycosyltransferase involved in cell wall biosynthesis